MIHDYVSPGFVNPELARHFPNMIAGNRDNNTWEYLRREVPHTWYVDRSEPVMGFISVDEAVLLHNIARGFEGRRAIEIGCWRGWSTAHLASAGVVLDVIDPVLHDRAVKTQIETMLDAIGARARVSLHAGTSQEDFLGVAGASSTPYSLAYIDGDHERDAPIRDAALVEPHMAHDAAIVFHDLVSPYVTGGLAYLRRKGWNTRIFQTMQVIGIAWRGNVQVPLHVPDPHVSWSVPPHLRNFRIAGEDDTTRMARFEAVAIETTDLRTDLQAAQAGIASMAASHDFRQCSAEAWIMVERQNSANWQRQAEAANTLARDTHDRLVATQAALEQMNSRGATVRARHALRWLGSRLTGRS